MDRMWQWVWDRYGPRYSWAALAVAMPLGLPVYILWAFLIVAVEESSHYVQAAAVTVVTAPVLVYVAQRPGSGAGRLVERWAAGQEFDRARALDATYAWTRGVIVRSVALSAVWGALLSVIVGAIAGATGLRLVQ